MKNLNILIISFLICCGKQKGIKEIISTADALVIEKVLNNPIPSPPTLIYIMDKSGYIHLTDYQELKSLYIIKYKRRFMSLSSFLYLTVNQSYKLEKQILVKIQIVKYLQSLKKHTGTPISMS
jgi:hypothetical protein